MIRMLNPLAAVLLLASCTGTEMVNNPEPLATPKVVITPESASVRVDSTIMMSAIYIDEKGDSLNESMMWQSSDTAIASIGMDGTTAGRSAGQTLIVASAYGLSDTAMITVEANPIRRTGTLVRGPVSYDHADGSVTLELNSEGKPVLTFGDDFESVNGPRLEVFLSKSGLPSDGITLGKLRQLSGAHSYELPAGVAIDTYDYVIVYCVAFNVVFGTAQLN
jgi:hypothetical protein